MRQSILRRLYDEALQKGLPLLGTPEDAAGRDRRSASQADAADALVRRYTLFSGATGFVCGLPGYLTMPVTIPSNLAGVALLQLHLCAALAVLAGRDPHDEAVRRRCLACVTGAPDPPEAAASAEGSGAAHDAETSQKEQEDEAEGLLRRLATKLGERGLRFATERAVGALSKAASSGARSLPLVGGTVGGLSDARSTQAVGQRARRAFFSAPAR